MLLVSLYFTVVVDQVCVSTLVILTSANSMLTYTFNSHIMSCIILFTFSICYYYYNDNLTVFF